MGDERAPARNVRHAFWLLVIAFAVSALSGGYLSGRAAVPQFAAAAPTVSPQPLSAAELSGPAAQTDELADDDFSQDAAVAVEGAGGDVRDDAKLAVAIVDAGHSAPLESPFLALGIPVTLVIDPGAPAAARMLRLAVQYGQHAYVQARLPLTKSQIVSLHAAFPAASGVAVRLEDAGADKQVRAALRAWDWGLLDEYGQDAGLRRSFATSGVRFAARSITVDDHVQPTYVAYMLNQAVHLARGRTQVVLARPFPGTLRGLQDLLSRASRDGVRFEQLP